jgi:hypothetical protein
MWNELPDMESLAIRYRSRTDIPLCPGRTLTRNRQASGLANKKRKGREESPDLFSDMTEPAYAASFKGNDLFSRRSSIAFFS